MSLLEARLFDWAVLENTDGHHAHSEVKLAGLKQLYCATTDLFDSKIKRSLALLGVCLGSAISTAYSTLSESLGYQPYSPELEIAFVRVLVGHSSEHFIFPETHPCEAIV